MLDVGAQEQGGQTTVLGGVSAKRGIAAGAVSCGQDGGVASRGPRQSNAYRSVLTGLGTHWPVHVPRQLAGSEAHGFVELHALARRSAASAWRRRRFSRRS